MNEKKVLLVDDDPQGLSSTRKILELAGYEVITASDGQEALEKVRPQPQTSHSLASSEAPLWVDVVVTDVRMPRMSGIEFLRALSVCMPGVPVILMTAYGRVEEAVWAMKLGAVDFLMKPFKRQGLLTAVDAAVKRSRKQVIEKTAEKEDGSSLEGLLRGSSRIMKELRENILQVAPTQAPVLITGESGTGKERVARSLHQSSARNQGPFIALNCGAIPETLIESELFGHEKGAFSGATQSKTGLFEAANEGTLFLDEIGEMPLGLQVKLLRVLQESEVRRVGSTVSKKIDVRVIAATNKNLREAVQKGEFRQDLLYRLEVVEMRVAPLRERGDDILELSYYFLREASRRHQKAFEGISEDAAQILRSHPWPGNVRELENAIERAVVFAKTSEIQPSDLPPHLARIQMASLSDLSTTLERDGTGELREAISVPLGTPLREVEDILIRKTLEATQGDKGVAAKLLGVNQRTIYRKIKPEEKSKSND